MMFYTPSGFGSEDVGNKPPGDPGAQRGGRGGGQMYRGRGGGRGGYNPRGRGGITPLLGGRGYPPPSMQNAALSPKRPDAKCKVCANKGMGVIELGTVVKYEGYCLVSVQGTVDLWSYIMPIDRYSHTL